MRTLEVGEFRPVDLAAVYRDLCEKAPNGPRPYTLVNMISSIDGKATIAGAASRLGTPVDHMMMRKIRAACDALAYGAGTLRTENVSGVVPPQMAEERRQRGTHPQPLRVVFSTAGDVPFSNRFFQAVGEPTVVFTSELAGASSITRLKPQARVWVAGRERVDLRAAMRVLREELDVRSVVVEGGPTLTYNLFLEGLVDELFLTLAPKIVGGEKTATIAEGPELGLSAIPLELISVYHEAGELFLRYRVRRDTA